MRILAADIGYGTTDILIYDSELPVENCPKLVIPSQTQQVAARIRVATAAGSPVVMDGVTMGGGPSGRALKEHLQAGLSFFASPAAALTFNDDLEKIRSWGVTVTDDPVKTAPADAVPVKSGDLDIDALRSSFAGLGISSDFDGAAIAVQDHGFAPGMSNRRFRFTMWRELLGGGGDIDSLAFPAAQIPEPFTRMRSVASLLEGSGRVIVMDTGPAAIRGALSTGITQLPPVARLVANAGNGHTLVSLVEGRAIRGLAEHHTSLLNAGSFGTMVREFVAARLVNDDVYGAGGHGCLPLEKPVLLEDVGPVLVTGPRRDHFHGSGLECEYAAPYGDMMLTGCFGLVGAWLRLA